MDLGPVCFPLISTLEVRIVSRLIIRFLFQVLKAFASLIVNGPGAMDTKDYVNKILDKIEADPDKTRVFNEGVLSKIEQNPAQSPNIEIKQFIEQNPGATPLEFFKNNDASYIDYNEFTTNAVNFPDVQT